MFPRLDYGNVLLLHIRDVLLSKLQSVHSVATRLVARCSRRHIMHLGVNEPPQVSCEAANCLKNTAVPFSHRTARPYIADLIPRIIPTCEFRFLSAGLGIDLIKQL